MNLVKWNPAKELLDFEREFSRMFNSLSSRFGLGSRRDDDEYENAVWMPMTDITETDDKYVINLDIPGVSKKDVKISYANGELSISGERKHEKEDKDTRYHRVERAYGKFYRSFNLPKEIVEDKIDAQYKDGALMITVPKSEKAKPKELEIKVN